MKNGLHNDFRELLVGWLSSLFLGNTFGNSRIASKNKTVRGKVQDTTSDESDSNNE